MIQITIPSLALLFLLSAASASDQIPGAPQKKPIALVNGVLHPISGPAIEDGTLIFDNGTIVDLGRRMKPPENAVVIDLKGQHVYPSLIESHSHMGLTEISSTRATLDMTEIGSINPNVSAHVSVNPDSELIPVTRANGVLIAVSAPSGGLVSGKASVLQLDGWTYEDMTLKPDCALMINWPRTSPVMTPGPATEPEEHLEDRDRERVQALKDLRALFENTRTYFRARAANPADQPFDSRLDSMIPVVEGQIPLLIAADRANQIQAAVAFGVEQNVKIILLGGHDAEMCAELLRRYDVPVIVDAVHKDPRRDHEEYDSSYTLPERLRRAEIRFCISGTGRSETWNTRNLPYQAATAAAYGLPYDDALRSVTQYPAEILGIADRVGTLEKGKDATLFVSDGDPLETETLVTAAWIQGRKVDLTSRHTQLYDKYRTKYRQLKNQR
ncbi:MAG: amidohydrolase family protein [Planctomycetaceae bacterium]